MIEKKNDVIIPEQVKDSAKFFDGNIKKGVIICSVWLLGKDGARDKLIGSQKRRVGRNDFVVKGKRYWINYNELKEGKKHYYYDCNVENAIGSLSFHELSDRKVVPSQAEHMLIDGVVKVLMAKGGIPATYLLVAFIIVGLTVALGMYLFSQYQTLSTQVEKLRTENTNLKTQLGVIPPVEQGAK